jgi:hypothetical protein
MFTREAYVTPAGLVLVKFVRDDCYRRSLLYDCYTADLYMVRITVPIRVTWDLALKSTVSKLPMRIAAR